MSTAQDAQSQNQSVCGRQPTNITGDAIKVQPGTLCFPGYSQDFFFKSVVVAGGVLHATPWGYMMKGDAIQV